MSCKENFSNEMRSRENLALSVCFLCVNVPKKQKEYWLSESKTVSCAWNGMLSDVWWYNRSVRHYTVFQHQVDYVPYAFHCPSRQRQKSCAANFDLHWYLVRDLKQCNWSLNYHLSRGEPCCILESLLWLPRVNLRESEWVSLCATTDPLVLYWPTGATDSP